MNNYMPLTSKMTRTIADIMATLYTINRIYTKYQGRIQYLKAKPSKI